MSIKAIVLPDGYGYSAIIALGVLPLMSFVQGSIVTTLRKAAKVPYPNPYATAEQVKTSADAYKFNCAQRAHGNLMENMPQTIALLLFSGLHYPTATPIAGAVWVLSRALYAYGYITSPQGSSGKGRSIGGAFWLAQLALLGMSVNAALGML